MENGWKRIGATERARAEYAQQGVIPGWAALYLDGTNCETYADFFGACAKEFHFPDYFGKNWNAWAECMGDLSWMTFDSLVIVLGDYDRFFCREKSPARDRMLLERYFTDIIRAFAVEQWKTVRFLAFSKEETVVNGRFLPEVLDDRFEMTGFVEEANPRLLGKAVCCDEDEFAVLTRGVVRKGLFDKRSLYAGNGGLGLHLLCPRCDETFPVAEFIDPGAEAGEPVPFVCAACGKEWFGVDLSLEFPADMDDSDGPSWIKASLTCKQCGKKYPAFFDAEMD